MTLRRAVSVRLMIRRRRCPHERRSRPATLPGRRLAVTRPLRNRHEPGRGAYHRQTEREPPAWNAAEVLEAAPAVIAGVAIEAGEAVSEELERRSQLSESDQAAAG